jgi:hypothetical protein
MELIFQPSWREVQFMQQTKESFFELNDLVPSLRAQFEERPLASNKIPLAKLPIEDSKAGPATMPTNVNRHSIVLTDSENTWPWEVPSLRELFRGDKRPPVLGDHPEAYEECFLALELHALRMSEVFGDRRDAEMREIYSALRRRPDGRSLGFAPDYMWQAAAILLGTHILSQAEFEAIVERLERSCRTFEQGPTSRNYIEQLWVMFDDEDFPIL